jgi:putative ABC transport system substrate-binding protein
LLAGVFPAQAANKVVAAVLSSDLPRYRDAHRAFVKALSQKGYDQSVIDIVTQNPNPDPISWSNSIRKFGAIGADIIITYGAPVTQAAMREPVDIPIVFVDVYGPVESGISRSMQTSGGKITGISSKVPLITLFKTVIDLKPIRTVGVIYSSREIGSVVQLKEAKRVAAQLGLAVVEVNVSSPTGIDNAFDSLVAANVDCIYVSECSSGSRSFERIAHKSNELKLPVISQMPGAAARGALVSLEIDPVEQGQVAAEYAARILGGKKPSLIPIASPKKIELIINIKAAKLIDIIVPFPVLSAATKILK